jgi:hypothetical protein
MSEYLVKRWIDNQSDTHTHIGRQTDMHTDMSRTPEAPGSCSATNQPTHLMAAVPLVMPSDTTGVQATKAFPPARSMASTSRSASSRTCRVVRRGWLVGAMRGGDAQPFSVVRLHAGSNSS